MKAALLAVACGLGCNGILGIDDVHLDEIDAPGATIDADPTMCVLGAAAWVDPVNGTDDTEHGGAAGVCAFRSIDYALTQSSGMINLAAGTYSDATFPIVLDGERGLDCDPMATGTRAVLTSAAASGGGLVNFRGGSNVLRNCVLDSQSSSGANCMVIFSRAFPPHTVANTEFANCYNNGIITQETGDNINISNSTFRDSAKGIWWVVTNPTGTLNNNTFSGNDFFDIECQDAAASVTGSGNRNGAAAPTCNNCANCPFN